MDEIDKVSKEVSVAKAKKDLTKRRDVTRDVASMKATDSQWELADIAIKAFIQKYPVHWIKFQKELKKQRTEYQLAKKEHKELRKANWRNTASFPVILDENDKEVDSLLPTLQKIIPGLTDKKSVNYAEFLRRYKIFLPGEKY